MGTSENMKGTPLGILVARIFWMMVGPLALTLLAFNVATKGGGWLTGTDVAYLSVLALVLCSRWLEYRSGHGLTAEGEPVTAVNLRRYLLLTGSIGIAVWVCANLIGNVWLTR